MNLHREVLETPSLSDHKYILTTLTETSSNSMYRRYKTLHGNHKNFLKFLSTHIEQISHQISNISNQQQLNETTKALQQLIIRACDHAYKKKQVNFIPAPNWWTQSLEIEKKRLRALRRRAQRANSLERQARFIQESKEKAIYKKKVKHARTSGWQQFCLAATNPYGKHYKAAFRKGVFPSQLAVLANSQPTGSLSTIANNFMDNMFPQPAYTVDYSQYQTYTQDDAQFSQQEVSYVVKHLPAGKAPGVDGIDNLVIKIIHKKFPHLLTSLFNKSLTLGSFPESFKIGNIVFFQKQGKDPSLSSSYRPISLLPALGKVLERLLTQRLTFHLERIRFISDRQFGFREGHSVDTAIDSLLNKIQEARTTSNHSIVLSIDIKGAFDNLHHEAIMKALLDSQSPSNITKVFFNLLQNRKVTVQTPTGPIERDQRKGCPQGSCSGPALWNLVANSALNLPWRENVHVQAFADDFAMVIHAPTKKKLKETAQEAINIFDNWCTQNHLEVAPEKTNYIIFSSLVASPRLTWKGTTIKKVQNIRYLGVYLDDKLNWGAHMSAQATKALVLHQNIRKIAGKNWGISQQHRRILYKTVVERMLAHGAAAWCLKITAKIARKLTSIQRPFLLSITGAYRTSPTAALQVITGLPPLHLQLQQEAKHITLTRLKKPLSPEITDIQPSQIESKAKGWTLHPSLFLNTNQICMTDGGPESLADTRAFHIFTDGSKTDEGVGAAYCIFKNKIITHQWKGQLQKYNTVFQAEITALREAIQYASENLKDHQVKVYVDNQASLYAIANPKTKEQIARQIFKNLIDNPNIKVSWIKAHANYPGNEKADELAKEATTTGQPYTVLLPTSHIKSVLKACLLRDWQELWTKGNTGRPIHKVLPKVSLHTQNWSRELSIFLMEHGPFPTYLHRFRLSQTDYCNCGGIGSPIHYATECPFTLSWHLKTPASSNIDPWRKSIAQNKILSNKICELIRFIHQNNDLFKIN
ncbi:Putative protein in type-1 retrotransposable element R1DM [Araneus ventricosus]|uniref:Retrovirus-related Pol polyprotein from type-1 retrotransposable element R1 n=1 Tax=Araneus ventricosus TaxID=182803 RepID=A0A4Y2M041_ARAVE|nr:Putative protein in type-1 retrotransposable element R1DM [Araneus ventricosus]